MRTLLVSLAAVLSLFAAHGDDHQRVSRASRAATDSSWRAGLRPLTASPVARTSDNGTDPFASLPLVAPGQLSGRIRYLSNADCELHEYDLQTGTDSTLAPSTLCGIGFAVFSPNGDAIAVHDDRGPVTIERVGKSPLLFGAQHPLIKAPGNLIVPPSFSPDGLRIAYYNYTRTRLWTVIADSRTGRSLATITGTCETAFTSRGVAYLRGGRLILGGRTIFRLRNMAEANTGSNGIGPEGNPLAANPQGTLLALATRPLRGGLRGDLVTTHVLRPDGHQIASYRARIDITVAFQALAPSARSAVIWWGDILQLAALGTPRGSLTLRYQTGNHSGDGEREIFPTAYSPDGAYAVMPRRVFAFHGEPPPAPQAALILSGTNLEPLYRLPIDAQVAVWLKPPTSP